MNKKNEYRARFYLFTVGLASVVTALSALLLFSIINGPYVIMVAVVSIVTPVTLLTCELIMTRQSNYF